jgi:hypothetical protein
VLGCVFGFDFFDAFLKFLSKNFLDELSSFVEEEGIEIVDHLTVSGVVHDAFAFVEHGIKVGVENGTRVKGRWE